MSSDDEEIIIPKKRKPDDDTDFMKHPFALKSSVPITINIAVTCYSVHFCNEGGKECGHCIAF